MAIGPDVGDQVIAATFDNFDFEQKRWIVTGSLLSGSVVPGFPKRCANVLRSHAQYWFRRGFVSLQGIVFPAGGGWYVDRYGGRAEFF